jgi:hypothetical protein
VFRGQRNGSPRSILGFLNRTSTRTSLFYSYYISLSPNVYYNEKKEKRTKINIVEICDEIRVSYIINGHYWASKTQ